MAKGCAYVCVIISWKPDASKQRKKEQVSRRGEQGHQCNVLTSTIKTKRISFNWKGGPRFRNNDMAECTILLRALKSALFQTEFISPFVSSSILWSMKRKKLLERPVKCTKRHPWVSLLEMFADVRLRHRITRTSSIRSWASKGFRNSSLG